MSAADRKQLALANLAAELSARIDDALCAASSSTDSAAALTSTMRILEGTGLLAELLARLINGQPAGIGASSLQWLVGQELAADITAASNTQNTRS